MQFESLTGKPGFDANGCDEIRFVMSANAGEELGRISRIASGGELSRIMLAAHYFGDVLVGTVFGLSVGSLCALLGRFAIVRMKL